MGIKHRDPVASVNKIMSEVYFKKSSNDALLKKIRPVEKIMKVVKIITYYKIRPGENLENIIPSESIPYSRPGSENFFKLVKENKIQEVLFHLQRDRYLKF